MSRFKVKGYVIRGISTGESSRIITLFTREKGKLKCMAKGVRKSAALKGGRLELFNYVGCNVSQKENAELGIISSTDLICDYSSMTADVEKFGLSSAFCEIIDKSTIDNEPVPGLFELAGEFFGCIQNCDYKINRLLFWSSFLKALSLLGYQPRLYECVVCGKPNKNRAAYYDPDRGGIICSKDIAGGRSYKKLSAKSLKMLQNFLTEPISEIIKIEFPINALKEAEKFILTFANYHTGLHRNLKSFKFLSQLKIK